MKIELKETMDGSHTLYLEDIDEHYHSTFGAVQESQHVFILSGFGHCQGHEITVLEIGLGTGLNCYLTLLAAANSNRNVRYYAIEKFPLPVEILEKLNFGAILPGGDPDLFSRIHSAPWNDVKEIIPGFFLHKMEADILQTNIFDLPSADLVYYDAFSPEKQPELWSRKVFEPIFSNMMKGGILVTYCAKGYVRRMLQDIGFQVERIPGPPGKREMLRARK
jgi:tRNA U34 5-methylaminomethyl-2-thiouridine-forming methyltransferase MnmC